MYGVGWSKGSMEPAEGGSPVDVGLSTALPRFFTVFVNNGQLDGVAGDIGCTEVRCGGEDGGTEYKKKGRDTATRRITVTDKFFVELLQYLQPDERWIVVQDGEASGVRLLVPTDDGMRVLVFSHGGGEEVGGDDAR